MRVRFEPVKGMDEQRYGFSPFYVEMPMPPDEGWTIDVGRVDKLVVVGKPELEYTFYRGDEKTPEHAEFDATVKLAPYITRGSYR